MLRQRLTLLGDMLDPQPTRMELLVRHVLLLREFLPQIGINSNHYGLLMQIRPPGHHFFWRKIWRAAQRPAG